MLYPALLVPLLIWIGIRYVPVVDGAGMLRVTLLVLLVGGLLTTQMFRIHRSAYPLSTWTMYSSPDAPRVSWDLRVVEDGHTFHFPWKRLAPVQEVRGIHESIARMGEAVFQGDRFPKVEGGPHADEVRVQLRGILLELGAVHARRYPGQTPQALELRRCEVDPRHPVPRHRAECPVVLSVPMGVPHGS